MKIINNKEKYTIGTKFRIFGVPAIIIGDGLAMTANIITQKPTWVECYNEANDFIVTHQGWYIPHKNELENYIPYLTHNMPHLQNYWLWVQTCEGDKAWNYDFCSRKFYLDSSIEYHNIGCMCLFYKLW